jgi:GT2 family glycosyltransferase
MLKFLPRRLNDLVIDRRTIRPILIARRALASLKGAQTLRVQSVVGSPTTMQEISEHARVIELHGARPWTRYSGWFHLQIDGLSQATGAELQVDIEGARDAVVLRLVVVHGRIEFPLHLPGNCLRIRLAFSGGQPHSGHIVARLKKLHQPALWSEWQESQRKALEHLGGREEARCRLRPLREIEPCTSTDYTWHATGNDPAFELKHDSLLLLEGWYLLMVRVSASVPTGTAKLYVDYGLGILEEDAVALPYTSGRTVKRLFRLKKTPRHIRFDPIELSAHFSVESLDIRPRSWLVARNGMLRRVYKRRTSALLDLGRDWRACRRESAIERVEAWKHLYSRYQQSFFTVSDTRNVVSYGQWIELVEQRNAPSREEVRSAAAHHRLRPLISIVMPTYNTPEGFLRRAIQSVRTQSYPFWELCVADDASTSPHVRAILAEYSALDERIKVVLRENNGHISRASNSALSVATGEFVALLDHDDELAEYALHYVAEAVNRFPSAQILYSDEDKIDAKGQRFDPYFKPDWNPDLLYSQNYVSHLGVYRRSLVERIGGFREGFEGSQDYDLLLRCALDAGAARDAVVHIPRILYHWRAIAGSTARDGNEKSYAVAAAAKALQLHLDEIADGARVDVIAPGLYRHRWPLPNVLPLVSLIIPTRDGYEVLKTCIESILSKTAYPHFEIVVVENQTTCPSTLAYLERLVVNRHIRIIRYDLPFNYSAINNAAAKFARGSILGLINNDVEVINADWLSEMVSHAVRSDIGCVGAKLYYPDDTIQHAGVVLGIGGVAGHSHKYFPRGAEGYFGRLRVTHNVSAVTGAALLVRREVFDKVGGLDEIGLKVAFNDVDFCIRVREAGYRNLWTPFAELYHHESKTRGAETTPEKRGRFQRECEVMLGRWGRELQADSCYNPNLTRLREDYSLALPSVPAAVAA